MIAALSHNCPELIEPLKKQVSQVKIIDVANDPPIEGALMRIENKLWVHNWDYVLRAIRRHFADGVKYLWMLNDDIEGASELMYYDLLITAKRNNAFMVTPSFNSPHSVFHSQGNGIREVNWVDMCCPLIDLDKYFELGGFDLNFVGYFADLDLSIRAKEKGFKMYVCDEHKINHLGGYTTNKVASDQSSMEYNQILIDKYGKSWNELI